MLLCGKQQKIWKCEANEIKQYQKWLIIMTPAQWYFNRIIFPMVFYDKCVWWKNACKSHSSQQNKWLDVVCSFHISSVYGEWRQMKNWLKIITFHSVLTEWNWLLFLFELIFSHYLILMFIIFQAFFFVSSLNLHSFFGFWVGVSPIPSDTFLTNLLPLTHRFSRRLK